MRAAPRLVAACLTVVAALAAPATGAEPPRGNGCGGVVARLPGGGWAGVLAGGPASAPGSVVEITCEIVEWETGVVVATASSGPQRNVAYAAAPATDEPAA